jgi:hypothetical protein
MDALPAVDTAPPRRKPWLTAGGVFAAVMALVGIRVWYARRRQPAAAGARP